MVRTPVVKEEILERVAEDPTTSTIRMGLELGVCKDVISRLLRERLLQPYHIQRAQYLLPGEPRAPRHLVIYQFSADLLLIFTDFPIFILLFYIGQI